MRRRDLFGLLGSTGVMWPLAIRAQQPTKPLIGFLSSRSPQEAAGHTAAFLQGLKAFGYVDGQTATIEYRWARGKYEELPAFAKELAGLQPAIIVAAGGTPSGRAAKAATRSIPIIFITSEPDKMGLVASLNRPGGNATGVDLMTGSLGGKRLELLIELVPGAKMVAFLTNPEGESTALETQDIEIAAHHLDRRLVIAASGSDTALEGSFSKLVEAGATGLVVENDPSFDSRRDQLIKLAANHRIPAIYHIREFPVAGGLMSYGPNLADAYYKLGVQAGRVLKGANVAELPVVRPTRFEFVINLSTAKALALNVSPMSLALADELIE